MTIGDPFTFIPTCLIQPTSQPGGGQREEQTTKANPVTGEIVYINPEKGWFRVRFRLPRSDGWQYECFKVTPPAPDDLASGKGYHTKWG